MDVKFKHLFVKVAQIESVMFVLTYPLHELFHNYIYVKAASGEERNIIFID